MQWTIAICGHRPETLATIQKLALQIILNANKEAIQSCFRFEVYKKVTHVLMLSWK
jgi:hypothetical protein